MDAATAEPASLASPIDIFELLKRPVPDHLYHYTSIEGLHGIVTSRSIRASMIHYLNDTAELKEAIWLCQKMLEREWKQISDLAKKAYVDVFDLWRAAVSDVDDLARYASVCVFSFSEQRDLLSQWRGYCPPDGGYVLGFQTSSLKACLQKQGFVLVPCVYDKSEQNKLLSQWVAPIISQLKETMQEKANILTSDLDAHQAKDEELDEIIQRRFFDDFPQIAPVIKHSKFSEEQEWRAISKRNPRLNFRIGRTMLLPYCEIDLRTPNFPVEKFIVGPGPHQKLAADSLRQFLISEKISLEIKPPAPSDPNALVVVSEEPAVELSALPYRRL